MNACSSEVTKETSLDADHVGVANVIIDTADSRMRVSIPKDKIDNWEGYVGQKHPGIADNKMWLDVFINYQISSVIEDDLVRLAEMDMINIILVPYTLLNAWEYETKLQKIVANNLAKDIGNNALVKFTDVWKFALLKMRTCHLKDRITKIIYSDRFCSSEEALESETERKTLVLTRNGD